MATRGKTTKILWIEWEGEINKVKRDDEETKIRNIIRELRVDTN